MVKQFSQIRGVSWALFMVLLFALLLGCSSSSSSPTTPTPTCNQQHRSGGDQGLSNFTIEMGQKSGTFRFAFRTFIKPDQIVITYEGNVLYDTNCVTTPGTTWDDPAAVQVTKTISYAGNSTQISVSVTPNCNQVTSDTGWEFTVYCPQ